MFNLHFHSQKEACRYFGHSWAWILKRYMVRYYTSGNGFELVKL